MTVVLIIGFIFQLLFYLAIIAFGLYIQAKLSKADNKYLGLILPVLAFLMASLVTLGITSFSRMTATVGGVTEVVEQLELVNILLIFLVTNIPTIVLSGIYYSERNKKRMKEDIDKMRIEDL